MGRVFIRRVLMYIICALIAVAVLFVIDWFIVMGADPRKWKGGDKNGK